MSCFCQSSFLQYFCLFRFQSVHPMKMHSKKWLWAGIGLMLGTGYTVAFLVYQIGTLITTGAIGTGFVPGLIVVAVFAAILVMLIRRNEKEFGAEYSLHA